MKVEEIKQEINKLSPKDVGEIAETITYKTRKPESEAEEYRINLVMDLTNEILTEQDMDKKLLRLCELCRKDLSKNILEELKKWNLAKCIYNDIKNLLEKLEGKDE